MVEAFFDELSDGICITDFRGCILYVNPAAAHILEASRTQLQGKRLCELLCGHLAAGEASECASACELLKPGSTTRASAFLGNYGPKEIATWKDDRVARRSVWRTLRVRCLKASSSLVGEGKHLTIIEAAAAELDVGAAEAIK
jgi:PAS domain-containing protein